MSVYLTWLLKVSISDLIIESCVNFKSHSLHFYIHNVIYLVIPLGLVEFEWISQISGLRYFPVGNNLHFWQHKLWYKWLYFTNSRHVYLPSAKDSHHSAQSKQPLTCGQTEGVSWRVVQSCPVWTLGIVSWVDLTHYVLISSAKKISICMSMA